MSAAERLLRAAAIVSLSVYVLWNAFCLARLQVPPSLLTALTGLPCPTTGGTRAMLALCDGRLGDSLRYHALVVPIAALFLFSLGLIAAQRLRGARLQLPRWLLLCWIGVLVPAWLIQLAADPRLW